MFDFLRRLVSSSSSGPERQAPTLTRDAPPGPLAAAVNAFALDAWRKVAAAPGDALFSPGSLWLALVMTTSGARGETRAELARLLHLPAREGVLDAEVTRQLAAWDLDAPEAGLTLRAVNRLFGHATGLEAGWLMAVERVWRAGFEQLSFTAGVDAARRHINGWVGEQTAEKISELLPAGSISTDTRLVLVNAVYFVARWAEPFMAHLTLPAPFFDGASERSVSMMRKVDTLPYVEVQGAQVLAMPYEEAPLQMVLVLPRQRDGLAAIEQALTPSLFGGGWRRCET